MGDGKKGKGAKAINTKDAAKATNS